MFIRQDPEMGDVILSRKPATWDDFFALLSGLNVPVDFLSLSERQQVVEQRDLFKGWQE